MSVEVPPERARATKARIRTLRREHRGRVLNGIFGTITVLASIATVAGLAIGGLLVFGACPVAAVEPSDEADARAEAYDVVLATFGDESPVRFDEHAYRDGSFTVAASRTGALPANTELSVMLRDFEPQQPRCSGLADLTPRVPQLVPGADYVLYVDPTAAERTAASEAEANGGNNGGNGNGNNRGNGGNGGNGNGNNRGNGGNGGNGNGNGNGGGNNGGGGGNNGGGGNSGANGNTPPAPDPADPRRVVIIADAEGTVVWRDNDIDVAIGDALPNQVTAAFG